MNWSFSIILIVLALFNCYASSLPTEDAVVEEPIISSSNASVSEAGGSKRTCACDDSSEQLVCASNGITYKNSCRFDCAKARVTRLRIVRQGQCSQTGGSGSYWQKKGGRK